jgi:DNA-binding IclR family transcriptional regulator
MCVHQLDNREPAFSVSYERGRMMPLDRGATSKVILAHLPANMLRRLARSQPQLRAYDEEMRRDMRRVKGDGFCIAVGEVDPGLVGIAVPIILPHRKQVASLSVVVDAVCGDAGEIALLLRNERTSIEMTLAANAACHA